MILALPIHVRPLDERGLAELRRRFETTSDPETRLRYHMVLLAQQGYSLSEIAAIIPRSRYTIARVFHRFNAEGLDAVPRRTSPGRPRTVNESWQAELVRVIELDPHEVGVPSANWTTRLLADYLADKTGIRVDQETVRVYLHVHGFVCKRPVWTVGRKAEERPDYLGKA
jgi:transposase